MNEDYQTIEIPQAQFVQHLIDVAREGPVEWNVADEVREDTGFRDVFNTETFFNKKVTAEYVELWFETTGTVTEQVARRTHHHPAEYENHDVTIHGSIRMPWTTERLPQMETYVEQEEHPTEPPTVDVDAYRYDL